jgi:hypothetical protein
MSENEVGFTSALGRALGYMGFGINKSIASRNEVEAAQSRQTSTHLAPVVPLHDVEQPFESDGASPYASPKQLGLIRVLAKPARFEQRSVKRVLHQCCRPTYYVEQRIDQNRGQQSY